MGRVAKVGCIACRLLGFGETPAHVHHIRELRIPRTDTLTIPLCPAHHTGQSSSIPSIHHRKDELLRQLNVGSEFQLLGMVILIIERERL